MSDATKADRMKHPGQRDGVQGEWLAIADVIPGHEAAIREVLWRTPEKDDLRHKATDEVGTVHNYRSALIDNDSRLVFASVFDGDWDVYIDDFGANDIFLQGFDDLLQHTKEYKGWRDPGNKDWLLARTVSSEYFISAYPDLTARQVVKNQRVNDAFQAVLDSPEFQAALKDPAVAPLLATPAFQTLLDEAAG